MQNNLILGLGISVPDDEVGSGGDNLISDQARMWMEPQGGNLSNLALGDATGALEQGSLALSVNPAVYSAGTVNAVTFDPTGSGTRIIFPNSWFSHLPLSTPFWIAGVFRLSVSPGNYGICANGANAASNPGFRAFIQNGNIQFRVSDGVNWPQQGLSSALGGYPLGEWISFVLESLPDIPGQKITARYTWGGIANYTLNANALRELTGLTELGTNPPSNFDFVVGDVALSKSLAFDGDLVLAGGELAGDFLNDEQMWYLHNFNRSRLWTGDAAGKTTDPVKILFAHPRSDGVDLSARVDQPVTFKALDPVTRAEQDSVLGTLSNGFCKASITGLGSNQSFLVEIHTTGGVSMHEGRYTTPPADNNFTCVVTGCSQWTERPTQIAVAAHYIVNDTDNPVMGVLVEDNGYFDLDVHYPSGATEEDWLERFDTIFNFAKAFYLFEQIPFMQGFGDHHFEDNGDSTSQYIDVAVTMARASCPCPSDSFGHPTEGWYHSTVINDLRFIMLDTRSGKVDLVNMLDATQTTWFKTQVAAGQIPIICWSNNLEFSPNLPITGETWEGYITERRDLFDHLATTFGVADKSCISITGDVHMNGLDTGLNQGNFDTGGLLRIPCIHAVRFAHPSGAAKGAWDTDSGAGEGAWGKLRMYNDSMSGFDVDLVTYESSTQQGTLTQNITKPTVANIVVETGETESFSIELNTAGVVQNIKDGDQALGLNTNQGLFYLEDVGANGFPAPPGGDFVNGDFASGLANWTVTGTGLAEVRNDEAEPYVHLDATAGTIKISQTVPQKAGYTVYIRGQMRTTNGSSNMFLQIVRTGGAWWKLQFSAPAGPRQALAQQQFEANKSYNDWTDFEYAFLASDGMTHMKFEAVFFAPGTGTMDLRNLRLETLDATPAAGVGTRMTHVITDAGGGNANISATGQNVTVSGTMVGNAEHIRVAGTVTGNNTNRALNLVFNLPIDQTLGWTWWNSTRYRDKLAYVADTQNIYYEQKLPFGREAWQGCTYPVAAIEDATTGVAIGNSIDQYPKACKWFRDSNGLNLSMQIGLNSTRNTAKFDFVFYRFPHVEWGMASALHKFQEIFSAEYVDNLDSTTHRHGLQTFYLNSTLSTDWDFISFDFRGTNNNPGWEGNHDNGIAVGAHPMGLEASHDEKSGPSLTLAQREDSIDTNEPGMDLSSEWIYPPTTTNLEFNRYGAGYQNYEYSREITWRTRLTDPDGSIIVHTFSGSGLDVITTNPSPHLAAPNQYTEEWTNFTQVDLDNFTAAGRDFRMQSRDNYGRNAGRRDKSYNLSDADLEEVDMTWDQQARLCFITMHLYWQTLEEVASTIRAYIPPAISVANLSASPQTTAIALCKKSIDSFGGESDYFKGSTNKDHFFESLHNRRAIIGSMNQTSIVNHDTNWGPNDSNLPELMSACYSTVTYPSCAGLWYQGIGGDFGASDLTEANKWFPLMKILTAADNHDGIPYITSSNHDLIVSRRGRADTGDLHVVVYNASDSDATSAPFIIEDRASLGLVGNSDWIDVYSDGGGGDILGVALNFNATIPARRAVVWEVSEVVVPTTYELRVEFNTVDPTPLTNPYVGETGALTPTETSGSLSVSGGNLLATGSSGWGNLGVVGDTGLTRVAGKTVAVEFTPIQNKGINVYCGWGKAPNLMSFDVDTITIAALNPFISIRTAGSTVALLGSTVVNRNYKMMSSLRVTGSKLYLNEDDGGWKLVWMTDIGGSDPVYPYYTQNSIFNVNVARIASSSSLWIQQPIVADGYTDADGTDVDDRESDADTPAEEINGNGHEAKVTKGHVEILGNMARVDTAAETIAVYESHESDVFIRIRMDPSSGSSTLEAIFRQTNNNNYWALFWDHTLDELQLIEDKANTRTVKATDSIAPSVPGEAYTLQIDADGLILTGRVLDSSDREIAKVEFDTTGAEHNTTATRHGFRSDTLGDLVDWIEIWEKNPIPPPI